MTDCLSCRHAFPAVEPGGRVDFSKKVCKADPPRPLILAGPNGQPIIQSFHPLVGKGVWCAKHDDPSKPRADLEGRAKALLEKLGISKYDPAAIADVIEALA